MLKFLKNKESQDELLSVIIPSYNHSLYIKQAINSVLNQTYRNLELIIVDDGSTDQSVEIIKQFSDTRIQFIEQKNQGAHNAINKGLKLAKGNFLAILNSDDIYDKRRFEIMIQEMNRENAEFSCSFIQVIDGEGKKQGIKKGWRNMEPWLVPNPNLSLQGSNNFALNLIMSNFTATTSNFLFTRTLYENIGDMKNLRFVHDWDFALRAAAASNCILVEKPLLDYRVHNSNTISSNRKWMLFEIVWIWAVHIKSFSGSLLFSNDFIQDDLVRIIESLNLQGNDKIFWIIKMFIEAQQVKGVERPEEILLEDTKLREKLLEYVVE